MTGKHSTKERGRTAPPALVQPAPHAAMPDPDNLQIDLSALPKTGPITLPRR